jgi:DNA-binding NarL/FixJ family response regulator
MKATMRVLLVDDHTLVRAGIRSLLEDMQDVSVVGEAADGETAIALARELRPDLVLMDIAMQGVTGLEAAARIRQELPQSKVLILSMHATEDYVLRALKSGASGYLVKDAATEELEIAIQAMRDGNIYLSPKISKAVVSGYVGGGAGGVAVLTARQSEILRMIAQGLATKEIAYHLGLSAKTVETHRAQIMERLGIHDVAGLVRYAIRVGMVTPDP